MSDTNKPNLIVLPGGKKPETVAVHELPNQVEFPCYECGASCLLWPKAVPMVQHALPACKAWKEVEAQIFIGKAPVFTKDFLEKCGVKMLEPVK